MSVRWPPGTTLARGSEYIEVTTDHGLELKKLGCVPAGRITGELFHRSDVLGLAIVRGVIRSRVYPRDSHWSDFEPLARYVFSDREILQSVLAAYAVGDLEACEVLLEGKP